MWGLRFEYDTAPEKFVQAVLQAFDQCIKVRRGGYLMRWMGQVVMKGFSYVERPRDVVAVDR